MSNEIDGAISIATDIVNQKRKYLVDYILSPFNDPTTATVSYRPPEEKNQFIHMDLGGLEARLGGDCDELAITGIQEIYSSSVMEFSPIYVFTDAGAKDDSVDNLDTLITSALAYATPINFFLSPHWCLKETDIQIYRNIALETGGEVLIFSTDGQLKEMSAYVKKALGSGCVIPCEGAGNTIKIKDRKKRATTPSRYEYSVRIDDTVEAMTVSVSTERDTSDIILLNPRKKAASGTMEKLKRGAVFIVTSPTTGSWTISVSNGAGKHVVKCRGASAENIDFSYEFIVGIAIRGSMKWVASSTPVKGTLATVIIAISAYEKVHLGSLTLQIMNEDMQYVGVSKSLQPYGKSPGRFTAKFTAPSSLKVYYLVVKGTTKGGMEFKRISPKPVKPQYIIIQTLMARNGYTIQAGSRTGTTVLLAVRNLGATERFSVTVVDSKGYLTSKSKRSVLVVRGRSSLLALRFKAPATAKRGSTYTVQVIVRGETSRGKQLKAIMMLVV